MGNVEVVLPGSMQFQPTAGIFDSGVDDLQKPKHYVIWDANVHQHIYAEYAVIIKSPSMTNGTTTATHMVLDFISLSIFTLLLFTQENLFDITAEYLVREDTASNISEIGNFGSPDSVTKVCLLCSNWLQIVSQLWYAVCLE
jgi:hypothetical protein